MLEEIGEVDLLEEALAPAGTTVACGVCWGDFEPQDIMGNRCWARLYDSTFSRTVWRLYGGAKGLVMWY